MPKIYGSLHKPKKDLSGFWLILKSIIILAVLLFCFFAIFFSKTFQIKNVFVEGANFSSEEDIKNTVPLGENIWLLPKQEVIDKVMKDSVIENVTIFRGLPNNIRIRVVERSSSLIWKTGDQNIVLDSEGTAFASFASKDFPEDDTNLGKLLRQLPEVKDTKNLPVNINEKVVSPLFLSFSQELRNSMKEYLPGVEIKSLELGDTTYDLSMILSNGMQVQLTTLGDAAPMVRNLKRLIDQKIVSDNAKIDLRIDRWAYIK